MQKNTILIIDDNEEILFVLSDGLKDDYHTLCIHSGTGAFDILQKNNISLVICDVMMPQMNGYEVCEKIKSDIDYSHIPVILLTAKNTLQSKIDGLHAGADVYIEKPFSMEFLIAQIKSLLVNRNRLKSHFAKSPTAHITSIAYSDMDKQFLETLEAHIIEHIMNPDLDVVLLAKCMNMSRTNLYRKISSISNLSPAEMINLTRLKKAIALLSNKATRLNEVAYTVGYNSVTQLGRNFQKHFNMTPSEFIKQHIKP